MKYFRLPRFGHRLAVSVAVCVFASRALASSAVHGSNSPEIIAEGTYVYTAGASETHEHWTLSKTAEGTYLATGKGTQPDDKEEFLNYKIEMDTALHPSLVELHTTMDLPSYTCKLTTETARCVIAFEPPNTETHGEQKAQMQAPLDLFGFHSCGWMVASIVQRLPADQQRVTVHLFLPSEDRYSDAAAQVTREKPETVSVAGKSFKAQRYTLKLTMDPSDTSSFTVWASRSGLVLKVQPVGESSSANLPAIELTQYKQTTGFVPELQQ